MMWNWGGGWWWLWAPLCMLVFAGVVAWVVVTLGRSGTAPRGSSGTESPEAVLAERLARGEIDAEEYEHRLDILQHPTKVGDTR